MKKKIKTKAAEEMWVVLKLSKTVVSSPEFKIMPYPRFETFREKFRLFWLVNEIIKMRKKMIDENHLEYLKKTIYTSGKSVSLADSC